MRVSNKIPLLLQLYTFDVNMPEEKLYELTIISKKDGSMQRFEANTWGKAIHLAFMFMNKSLKEESNGRKVMV